MLLRKHEKTVETDLIFSALFKVCNFSAKHLVMKLNIAEETEGKIRTKTSGNFYISDILPISEVQRFPWVHGQKIVKISKGILSAEDFLAGFPMIIVEDFSAVSSKHNFEDSEKLDIIVRSFFNRSDGQLISKIFRPNMWTQNAKSIKNTIEWNSFGVQIMQKNFLMMKIEVAGALEGKESEKCVPLLLGHSFYQTHFIYVLWA